MKIAVIGIGTAGVQTLSYLLGTLPQEISVVSIHDPAIPILGIGESTTTALPYALWKGCGFTMVDDAATLDATTKHGVKYVNWRSEEFSTHILPPYHGIHFNNFKLGEMFISKATAKWPDRFGQVAGKISNITQTSNNVIVTVDGVDLNFDYIVDCRGYPDDYTDYNICEDLPVNHGLVHTIPEEGTWNFTYHRAHKNGWMFGIPLKTRQGWGYLYNDKITSKEDAIADISEIFNTPVDELALREFTFKNYYANKFIDGRIIKNGNRALFFEPLEALSGYFYEAVCVEIAKLVMGERLEDEANASLTRSAKHYENFICFVYHGGSTFDSEFWKQTKEKTSKHLANSKEWAEQLQSIQTLSFLQYTDERIIMEPVSILLWRLLDDKLNYGYFK